MSSRSNLLLLVSVACLLVVRVASINLTITPDHVRVSLRPQSVSYTCTADVALAGCQFRWWDRDTKAGPLLELSRGSQSQANSSHLGASLTGYSYSGRGLGAGDCGVSLQVEGYKRWMVACRVRAETGGWTYAWAHLNADSWDPLPYTVTTRESVVLPGGEARFSLKAQESLSACRFFPPGLVLNFDKGAQSPHSTGRHLYLGGGLKGGECGLTLANVSEEDNGPVWSYIASKTGSKDDRSFMALIVASPPGSPILNIIYTDAGVTATCVVPGGRPVARISWVLGDQVVRIDFLDDSSANNMDEWRWPWTKGSVQQNLTLERHDSHHGKVLKCEVSHVTLAQPLVVTKMILFPETTTEPTPLATSPRTTAQPTSPSPGPHTTPDPTCTATSMLGLLCQEYRGRASQLDNTSCPRDEVYELRVREAGAAARSAELAEEQAKVNLEATKVNLEAANVTLEAAKSSAKAEETSRAMLAQVALEAAKAEETSRALLAQVALEAAKVNLEAAKSSAKSEETSRAMLAQVALEAAKSSAKSEAARAREKEAWAKNAEEELEFERQRRGQSLPQPQTAQSEQG